MYLLSGQADHEAGMDDKENSRHHYECKECSKRFDDLTDMIFASHHQPLSVDAVSVLSWPELSTRQIAQELNLNKDDAQHMAEVLRSAWWKRSLEVALLGVVQREMYVVAGHKV